MTQQTINIDPNLLKKLDDTVMAGRAAKIETNYGEAVVHNTRFDGFVAEIFDFNEIKHVAFGVLPSQAFLKVAGMVKEVYN